MQSNQNLLKDGYEIKIIDNTIWQKLYEKIENGEKLNDLSNFIQNISIDYNIDKKNIIKDFLNYIIRNKSHIISQQFLNFVENIMHIQECRNMHYINYSLSSLSKFIKNDS